MRSRYGSNFYRTGEDKTRLRLLSSVPLRIDGDVFAHFTLTPNQTADFLLEHIEKEHHEARDFKAFITQSLFDTVNYWKNWIAHSTYRGRWMEIVNRSALVLKLLTSYQYGSIIAAPTFSLPESISGKRNWDYRYTWIRDASFTIYALIRLGIPKKPAPL